MTEVSALVCLIPATVLNTESAYRLKKVEIAYKVKNK